MKKFFAYLFIFIVSVSLCGCGSASKERRPAPTFSVPTATVAATPAVTAAPRPTVTPDEVAPLSEAVISCRPPQTLNPLLNADVTVDRVLRLMFEPMTAVDGGGFPLPNLRIIERITFAPDGLSAEIAVADGAVWEDGENITGADVAFSFETLMAAPDDVIYKGCVKFVESCEVAPDGTVVVRFTEADVLHLFAFSFPVISRAYYGKEITADSPRNMRPLGDGAFAFSSYEPAKQLRLTARGDVSGNVRSVTAVFAADGKADAAMFETGRTNALFTESAAGVKRKDAAKLEAGGGTAETLMFNAEATGLGAEGRALRRAILALNAGGDAEDAPVNPVEVLTGRKINVIAGLENAERLKAAYALSERLVKAGAVVTLEELPFDEFSARVESGGFTAAFCGVYLPDKPHEAAAFLAGLSRFSTDETAGIWGKIEAAAGFDEYRSAVGELTGCLSENAAFERLYDKPSVVVYDKGFTEEDIQFVVREVLK